MLYEKNVLFVDLDGTLVSTDALLESILIFLKANPLMIIFLFMWLLKDKAYFKDQLAQRVMPNPATLPYHRNVLEVYTPSNSIRTHSVRCQSNVAPNGLDAKRYFC